MPAAQLPSMCPWQPRRRQQAAKTVLMVSLECVSEGLQRAGDARQETVVKVHHAEKLQRHEEVFQQAKRSYNGCFDDVLWCHGDLMVASLIFAKISKRVKISQKVIKIFERASQQVVFLYRIRSLSSANYSFLAVSYPNSSLRRLWAALNFKKFYLQK